MDFVMQPLTLFHKGGPVMYLLLVCSMAVVYIAVERFSYFRRVSSNAASFHAQLRPLLDAGRLTDAAKLCQEPTCIAQISAAGVDAWQQGESLAEAMRDAAVVAAGKLRESLSLLSAIVTVSPLLGLLGTVLGMISTFSVLNLQSGQPSAISGGVGEALIATASGLCVAVMAFLCHVYFTHRLDRLITDMESIGAAVQCAARQSKLRRDRHEIA